MSKTPQPLIDVPEAQEIVLGHVLHGPKVRLALREALFRTLAESVRCDIDYPPFDRALMDGYAVMSADVAAAPVRLQLAGQIPAGRVAAQPLSHGEAMQINTGAPIPLGADAVVRVEETEFDSVTQTVLIQKAVPAGQFITSRAAYVAAGRTVLQAGQRLNPLEIAVAAAAGAAAVSVYRQPNVAVLSTGDELVDIEKVPQGAEIRNSNQAMLEALVRSAYAKSVILGVARDAAEPIREKIVEGLKADVLCITGGVSMGAFDFVPSVLAELGAEFHIRTMAIKPGRPTLFATTPDHKLIFALPGNPVSAFVGFELLVRPALAALEGRPGTIPRTIQATLRGVVAATSDRRSYRPARAVITDDGQWEVSALSWRESGDPFGMAGANALIVRPPFSAAANSGDRVAVLLLERIE